MDLMSRNGSEGGIAERPASRGGLHSSGQAPAGAKPSRCSSTCGRSRRAKGTWLPKPFPVGTKSAACFVKCGKSSLARQRWGAGGLPVGSKGTVAPHSAGSSRLRIAPSAVGNAMLGKGFDHCRSRSSGGGPPRTSHAVVFGFQDQARTIGSRSRV